MVRRSKARGALLIYGATGYIGGLTAVAAIKRGLEPLLGGRNGERLCQRATQLGLAYRVADLHDPGALDAMLADVRVVINAAGPFSETWSPLVDACLRCGVHYLDLAGEVLVFEAVRARGAEARHRGVLLLPGTGFDVVPSDCLAASVAAQVPEARVLRLAVSGLELMSRGSARTLAEEVRRPTFVRRGGRLVPVPAGSIVREFDFGAGPARSVVVNWGDLASAFTTTGIGDIETYFEATPSVDGLLMAHRFWQTVLAVPAWTMPGRSLLRQLATWLPDGPSDGQRQSRAAVIVAEVEDATGRTARARLRTPEAYTFSAETAAAIAGEVLAGRYEPGFHTPAGLFGSDYVLQFDGVSLENVSPAPR